MLVHADLDATYPVWFQHVLIVVALACFGIPELKTAILNGLFTHDETHRAEGHA